VCRFLLVSLNIDAILGEVTIRQRRKRLEEMTQGNGLSGAYRATLSRLKAQKGYKSILGLKVLMWVLHSERPLRAEELCHTLGIEIGSPDLDPENVPALRTLMESCLGLVTVEASSSTVRLVHFTLQEHLLRDLTLFHNPHSAIADVCLTYLNSRSVRDLSPTLDSATATMPLLEYASIYWAMHTRRGMTGNIKILALRLLDRFDEHISAQLLLLHNNEDTRCGPWFRRVARGPRGFTGLHGVAALGIVEILPALLDMKEWDVNATDFKGNTPLAWAAEKGHDGVVKMLLERKGLNPNKAGAESGKTPLWLAAGKGHEGVVKMFSEREDVNPDHTDTINGETPLMWTAWGGHEGIVKLLLEREDVDPDRVDTKYGQTPLSWAARNGHEGVVKILLEREDVNPDHADTIYDQTPLLLAAENGHEGVVKIVLEREDVNPNRADIIHGQTPLSRAAQNGHEGVVRMLSERKDVNPDQPESKHGRTPLSWAAGGGHEGIVKMFLQREDVNPNQGDAKYGRKPYSWAADGGHVSIVKMLMERRYVNPNQAVTHNGHTLLSWESWAAGKEHEGIVEMLWNEKMSKTRQTPNLVPLYSRGRLRKGTRG